VKKDELNLLLSNLKDDHYLIISMNPLHKFSRHQRVHLLLQGSGEAGSWGYHTVFHAGVSWQKTCHSMHCPWSNHA